MSAAVETYRDEMEATYAVDFTRNREPVKARKRFPEYRRSGGAPTRVNGMQCRRNKRWTWGTGRGARVQNLRAFAGALTLVISGLASSASAVTLDMVSIPNVGNAAFFSNGLGGVNYAYDLSRTEMTNQQYVDFLNAVGATNPNGIYNSNMGSSAVGGIVQAGSMGNFTYTVKAGNNSMSQPYANVPVNFVSWFSAARFANWLHNGETTNPALLETGSYTLGNATSGSIVARNLGASYVLPNIDEWVKGAFNNGMTNMSYTIYGTNNNVKPASNVVTPSTVNTANYGGAAMGTTAPLTVGSYTNSQSFYGLYETMGNVAEMTDSANGSGQWAAMSGSFGTSNVGFDQFNLGSLGSPVYVTSAATTAQIGFRIGNIQPVPEPGTIALAGAGLAGMAGLEWKRRRKNNLALMLAA